MYMYITKLGRCKMMVQDTKLIEILYAFFVHTYSMRQDLLTGAIVCDKQRVCVLFVHIHKREL